MNRTSLYLSVGALLIAAAAGCQAIAGLQTRSYDPQLTGCGLPGVGLASTGNGRVRLANMANVGPGTSTAGSPLNYTDFCIRTSGSDWGRPLFRDGGNDSLCVGTSSQPGGLAYSLATVPFSVPVGKIDVKAIPSGQTCSAKGTSETDGIAIGDNVSGTSPVVTLVRWGGGSTNEAIAALPERDKNIPSTEAGDATVRLVNALSDGKSITFGTATSPLLPSTINFATITTPVAPGTVPAPQAQGASLFAVDSTGYMEYPPQPVNFAAAYSTDTTNTAITDYPVPSAAYATYYVIGDPGDAQNRHAVRAVYCDDIATAASSSTDAGAVGVVANIPAADRALIAQCTLSNLALLTVDMVNASLYGSNAPFEQARAAAIPAAIAARTSDIMCVVEVDDDTAARTPIINAAKTGTGTGTGQFPYSFDTVTITATPPTLAADNKGAPATPPCGGSVNSQYVTNWLNCVDQNCSTVTGGDPTGSGYLNGTSSCLEDSCLVPLLKIYTSPLKAGPGSQTYDGDACFDCTIYYLTSEQLSQAQQCVTDSVYPFAFNGQTPDLILSHYPLQNTKAYIFPATGFRRSVLKAQVVLEDQTIDFFCAQLSSPFIDATVPYTGNYGSDQGPNSNGWEDEQDLQEQEAIAWIQSETAADGLPAVIASDLHSSLPQQGSGGGEDAGALTKAQSPEVYNAFASVKGVQAAIPQNYTEGCDYCPATAPAGQGTNPYNGDDGPYEIMHTFLLGFPQNATQSETLWGNDPTAVPLTSLPGEPAPASGTGPLFEYYAHSYQMLRPTPK